MTTQEKQNINLRQERDFGELINDLLQFTMVLPQIVVVLCYFSLVEKKDGSSLMDRINTIGKDRTAGTHPEESY